VICAENRSHFRWKLSLHAHFENRFSSFLTADNDLCTPVILMPMLEEVLRRMDVLVESMLGTGERPQVTLDLEHLQVADYGAFASDDAQRATIARLHATDPVRPDHLAYLALRSMIGLNWTKVESESDIERAAAFEKALELALLSVCEQVSEGLVAPNSRLPYWGRLAFLRVMTAIPEENLQVSGLDRVACVLLKDPVFNARSYQYDDHALIGLNFALEPILKGLNRMLLHFFHSHAISGPKRMHRAWNSLAPVVGYFWLPTPTSPNRLTPSHPLFDPTCAQMAHSLTASQVDFIVRHEIGHLVLDHGRRLRAVTDPSEAQTLRQEFEFSADAFAHGGHRSALYSRFRSELQWNASQGGVTETAESVNAKLLEALQDYQRESTAVRLLFAYMDVIERLGELLKRRLGYNLFRSASGTHPNPRERRSRLDAFYASEGPATSHVIRYADSFFSELVAYAESLSDDELAAPLREH
jgi:hypothetical protein